MANTYTYYLYVDSKNIKLPGEVSRKKYRKPNDANQVGEVITNKKVACSNLIKWRICPDENNKNQDYDICGAGELSNTVIKNYLVEKELTDKQDLRLSVEKLFEKVYETAPEAWVDILLNKYDLPITDLKGISHLDLISLARLHFDLDYLDGEI